jgi:hypothetical protein
VVRRVCDLGNLVHEEAIGRVGLQRHIKKVTVSTYWQFFEKLNLYFHIPEDETQPSVKQL